MRGRRGARGGLSRGRWAGCVCCAGASRRNRLGVPRGRGASPRRKTSSAQKTLRNRVRSKVRGETMTQLSDLIKERAATDCDAARHAASSSAAAGRSRADEKDVRQCIHPRRAENRGRPGRPGRPGNPRSASRTSRAAPSDRCGLRPPSFRACPPETPPPPMPSPLPSESCLPAARPSP